eukprot:XP_014772267.1 PREDICTED: tigger transposable element-derived protein 4-like [Octopus bimaculoides]
MTTKRKRNDLSIADQYEAVILLGQKMSQTEVAKKLGCSQSQISRLTSKKEEIIANYRSNANPKRKRQRSGKDADVEGALSQWFNNAKSRGIPLSGPILSEKAKDLAEHLNRAEFNPTSGWLSRWKVRHNIRFKKLNCEKKDAVDNWTRTVLPEILQTYNPDDIYIAGETGLLYRALPDFTLTLKSETKSRTKNYKDRVTIMGASNMSGNDKRKLLVIGKNKDPRSLNGKTLPVTYKHSKNALMTLEIFTTWLREFDIELTRKKRKIVLLVDSCTAHPAITNLKQVKLMFFPSKIIKVKQPCNQGIIKALKSLYRSALVRNLILDIDGHPEIKANAKKITLLDAIHLIAKSWNNLKTSTIVSCFQKAGFTCVDTPPAEEDVVVPPTMLTKEQFEEYVTQDDDLECYSIPTYEELVASFMSDDAKSTDSNDSNDEDDKDVMLPVSTTDVGLALSTVRRFLEENNCENFDSFYAVEDLCESIAVQNHRQSKITEVITWIP